MNQKMKTLIKSLSILFIVLFVGACSCEKSVSNFNKRTLKKERKLLDKGCLELRRDSIPTSDKVAKLPDTIYQKINIPGPTIRDTFKIECDEEGNVVYKGSIIKDGIVSREVKCPDIDSVITIYNENKVKESQRADYCCAGWEACEKRRGELASTKVCGFWCKAQWAGAGSAATIILLIIAFIVAKTRGMLPW